MGKKILNSVPSIYTEFTSIVPPCFSTTIDLAIANPNPVPFPTPLVVNKSLKILSRTASLMPTPLSLMPITAYFLSHKFAS